MPAADLLPSAIPRELLSRARRRPGGDAAIGYPKVGRPLRAAGDHVHFVVDDDALRFTLHLIRGLEDRGLARASMSALITPVRHVALELNRRLAAAPAIPRAIGRPQSVRVQFLTGTRRRVAGVLVRHGVGVSDKHIADDAGRPWRRGRRNRNYAAIIASRSQMAAGRGLNLRAVYDARRPEIVRTANRSMQVLTRRLSRHLAAR